MGHGLTNSVMLTGLSAEKEAAVIAEAREVIEQWGQKMRGWLGPGLGETWHTLDLLRQHGVDYVCDWVNDDLPYRMNNGLYSIPYSIELNDMPLFNMPSISIDDFYRRICETFDVLYEEGERNGRVMAVALHPHARPGTAIHRRARQGVVRDRVGDYRRVSRAGEMISLSPHAGRGCLPFLHARKSLECRPLKPCRRTGRHESRRRQLSIGGPAPAWRAQCARRCAAGRAARGVPGAARLWLQQRKPDLHHAGAGAQ